MTRHSGSGERMELMSTGKAAKYLQCSRQSVRNLIGSGFLRSAPLPMGDDGGSHYRVYSQDVFRLADQLEKERKNTAPNGQPFSLKGHRLSSPIRRSESGIAIDLSDVKTWEEVDRILKNLGRG